MTHVKWIWLSAFLFGCSSPSVERPTEPLVELNVVETKQPEVQFDPHEIEDVLKKFARHAHRYFGGQQNYSDGSGKHPWHRGTHVLGDPTTFGMPVAFEQLCFPGGTLFDHEFAKAAVLTDPTPATSAVSVWFERQTQGLGDFSVRYTTGQSTGVHASATFTAVKEGRDIARIDIGIRTENHGPKIGDVQFLDP